MSQDKKHRSHTAIYLLSGLFAGILIGFGTALVLQNQSITDIVPLFQSRQDTTVTDGSSSSGNRKKGKLKSAERDQSTSGTSGQETDSYLTDAADTISLVESGDTLQTYDMNESDQVLRDERVGTRKVKVTVSGEQASFKAGSGSATDSLLAALTSVKPGEGLFSEYTLEFWKNPVNYRGYKFIKDRIILFGLPADQPYQLVFDDGRLMLRSQKLSYPLRETTEFLPLNPIRQSNP